MGSGKGREDSYGAEFVVVSLGGDAEVEILRRGLFGMTGCFLGGVG